MDVTTEAAELMASISDDLKLINQLNSTNNMRFLTRVEREKVFTRLLSNGGALEDILKAVVRAGREVRRARIRDDDQLSRMVIGMSAHDLAVGDFETPTESPSPAVAALYSAEQPFSSLDTLGVIGRGL